MILDFMKLGGVEVWNHARLAAHLRNVGSPFTSGADICMCESLDARVLEQDGEVFDYTTPDDPDMPAPWHDPDVPESADFLGFMVLSVDGLDDYPVRRNVTNAVTGGGSLGPARVFPRTITVTGLLVGARCCSVEYGLHWIAEALQTCSSGKCDGDCATMYNCCPPEGMSRDEFNARHRRTFRRVALTSGPTVTARNGTGSCSSGQCASGADILTVEFILTAASPWAWTDEEPVLEASLPTDDNTQCIDWCVHDPNNPEACECRLAGCVDAADACADPACTHPAPPVPTSPDTCACEPLAVNRECYSLDLSDRPAWSSDVPMISVYSGSEDLRHFTIELFERGEADEGLSCEEVADRRRCEPLGTWTVGFLPAGAELLLDGQTGRATVYCGGECMPSPYVTGPGGGPTQWPEIGCSTLCICLSTDALLTPAPDSKVTVAFSGKGY